MPGTPARVARPHVPPLKTSGSPREPLNRVSSATRPRCPFPTGRRACRMRWPRHPAPCMEVRIRRRGERQHVLTRQRPRELPRLKAPGDRQEPGPGTAQPWATALTGPASHPGICALTLPSSRCSSSLNRCRTISAAPPALSRPSQANARTASPARRPGSTSCHSGAWRNSIRSWPSFNVRFGPDASGGFPGDGAAEPLTAQNIVLSFSDDSGITCSTSQCSTIFPRLSKRKMSMPA